MLKRSKFLYLNIERSNFMEDKKAELISADELCSILKVCKNTAYHLLKSGELSGFKIGRMWRVPLENVTKYIDNFNQREVNRND